MAEAVAQAVRALDLPERQCLVFYGEDANGLRYHHRLLLVATPLPGRWIIGTPTYEVQVLDLNEVEVVVY